MKLARPQVSDDHTLGLPVEPECTSHSRNSVAIPAHQIFFAGLIDCVFRSRQHDRLVWQSLDTLSAR